MENDFYKILGVDKNVSQEDLKRAYRKFAMKYHPDHQHGKTDVKKKEAEETFKNGQAAYECLSDPEKRKIYDQYGIDGLKNGFNSAGGFSDGMSEGLAEFLRQRMGDFGFHFGMDDMDFNPFAHRENQKRKAPSNLDPEDGRSYRIRMQVDLEDVIFGNVREFEIIRSDVCPECHGRKCDGYEECPKCNGSGMFNRIQGNMIFQSTCQTCGGSGYVTKNTCKKCGGSGRVKAKNSIKLRIPVGCDEESQLRIRGAGEVGLNGGKTGDLLIEVTTKEHPVFNRVSKLDLQVDLFVNPLTTVYGGNVSIPTPYEMKTTYLHAGMKNGQKFRLNGYGIRKSENERGDLIVRLVFDTIDANQLDLKTDEILRKACVELENAGSKCLPGVKRQQSELNKCDKLPWILKM